MNDVTVTDAITSVVVETGNVVEISETNNQVTIADKTNLTVTQTTNSVSIENVENKVEVLSTAIEVVSVGTQGPQGPSGTGTSAIGGKDVPTSAPSDGDFIVFSSSSDEFVYTQEIDAGTY
tara:strand:- start:1782 stop:2144 length:363 start_codon:yes stop_codon:yes gene_type:complete